ncbi:hypothetical protein ACJZ2D_001659 [Fusarium nematophilum]
MRSVVTTVNQRESASASHDSARDGHIEISSHSASAPSAREMCTSLERRCFSGTHGVSLSHHISKPCKDKNVYLSWGTRDHYPASSELAPIQLAHESLWNHKLHASRAQQEQQEASLRCASKRLLRDALAIETLALPQQRHCSNCSAFFSRRYTPCGGGVWPSKQIMEPLIRRVFQSRTLFPEVPEDTRLVESHVSREVHSARETAQGKQGENLFSPRKYETDGGRNKEEKAWDEYA